MTEANRGAVAFVQAYAYIEAGGMYRTRWGRRRAAMRYLLVTASPPLTPEEVAAAREASRLIAREMPPARGHAA